MPERRDLVSPDFVFNGDAILKVEKPKLQYLQKYNWTNYSKVEFKPAEEN